MLSYLLTFVGGAVVGAIADRTMMKADSSGSTDKSKILEECFGAPMCTDTFTIEEAKEWILSRKEQLGNGVKAVIMKINDDTLKSLGKNIKVGSQVDNMMVVAIVNTEQGGFNDSVLIKYKILDEKLERMLAKGNGVLVVER